MILSGSKCVASYDPRDGQPALDHRRADRAVRGLDGLQRQAAVPDRRLSRAAHAGHPARRPRQRHRHAHRLADTARRPATSPRRSPRAITFWWSSDGGVASCFEADTGKRLWIERLGTHYSSSLVSAGGLVYFTSDEGNTTSSARGRSSTWWPKTTWAKYCYASPAISGGQDLFPRREESVRDRRKAGCAGEVSAHPSPCLPSASGPSLRGAREEA